MSTKIESIEILWTIWTYLDHLPPFFTGVSSWQLQMMQRSVLSAQTAQNFENVSAEQRLPTMV